MAHDQVVQPGLLCREQLVKKVSHLNHRVLGQLPWTKHHLRQAASLLCAPDHAPAYVRLVVAAQQGRAVTQRASSSKPGHKGRGQGH